MPRAPKPPPGPLTLAVATVLREKMEELGLTKSELSRLSGVQRTMTSDIVRGLQQADIEQVEDLANAMGMTLVEVLSAAEAAMSAK